VSRNFLGGFTFKGGSGSSSGSSGGSSKRGGGVGFEFKGGGAKGLAKIMMMEKLTGKIAGNLEKTKREEYMESMREKLAIHKKGKQLEAESDIDLTDDGRYKKSEVDNLSDSAKFMLKKYMEKKKKKKEDEKKRNTIHPFMLRNGRVDMSGIITTRSGRRVGYIDLKNGWVCNNMGMRISRFNPKHPIWSFNDIERMIDDFRGINRNPYSNNAGPGYN